MPCAILLGALGNSVLLLAPWIFLFRFQFQGQRFLGSVEPLMWMISQVDELVYAGNFCGGSGTPSERLPPSLPPSLLNKYGYRPNLTLPITVLFDMNLGLLCGLHTD